MKREEKKLWIWYKAVCFLEEPFIVLIDGNFLHRCVESRLDISTKINAIIGGGIKTKLPQCVFEELVALGEEVSGSRVAAKRFQRFNCNHSPALPANKCIDSILSQGKVYCVATQDIQLKRDLHRKYGIPIFSVHSGGNRILLDIPPKFVEIKKNEELHRFNGLMKSERRALAEAVKGTSTKRPHKKPKKGPNPMSIKKKKPKVKVLQTVERVKHIRHRSRKQKRLSKLKKAGKETESSKGEGESSTMDTN
eukprot:c9599_g1_i1.p1 GENE.c9599_g1_i1~~c9599_g1_i1.p1  ORF type:complete len:251 (+),score=86.53 c9599_g1_i1:25-777(+)